MKTQLFLTVDKETAYAKTEFYRGNRAMVLTFNLHRESLEPSIKATLWSESERVVRQLPYSFTEVEEDLSFAIDDLEGTIIDVVVSTEHSGHTVIMLTFES